MDKDYSSVIIKIIVVILIITGLIGFKMYLHKREILKLLQEEPIEYMVNIPSNNDKSYNSKKLLSSNIKSHYMDKKIENTSTNVTKKQQSGKDLISDIESNIEINTITSENIMTNTNSEDVLLLARLIMSEAGDEPYLGKLAVGNVVLYRAEEDNESISDTIFKKNQFDGIHTDNFNIQPNDESIQAATEVMNGEKAISDGYFFVNLNIASPSWAKTDNFIARIGDHWFFRKEGCNSY